MTVRYHTYSPDPGECTMGRVFFVIAAIMGLCLGVSALLPCRASAQDGSPEIDGDAATVVVDDHRGPLQWAFIRLDCARREKVAQLKLYSRRTHELARRAAEDNFIAMCFDVNRKYYRVKAAGSVPQALTDKVQQMREAFNRYYIQNYFAFHDILFVNDEGDVVFSIRNPIHDNVNLIQATGEGNRLVECLKTRPRQEQFIDFSLYGPSMEPAAFFVEPVKLDGREAGWLVLQCSANKINSLFAWSEDLGQTGETFLVNRRGQMLTESNFEGASTILHKKLDDRNIQAKFNDGSGRRIVTDYRACTALSSFEVVEFLGTRWLVVAKVDRDEIITQHFITQRHYFEDALIGYLREHPTPPLRDYHRQPSQETRLIDMDEFGKVGCDQRLETFGVSTCTAVLATYPGKFAYLAHISPRDRIYGQDQTNLLGQMIKKINIFDIFPCQKRQLTFVVVATHLDSMRAAINKLLDEGFLLSQIRILCNLEAESASVRFMCGRDDLDVVWKIPGDDRKINHMDDAQNAGAIVERLMNPDGDKAFGPMAVKYP